MVAASLVHFYESHEIMALLVLLHQIQVQVYILVKMAELSTVEMIEITNSSPKFSNKKARNEVELGEGQLVSTSLAPVNAETHHDEVKDEEGRTKAAENENMSLEETNNSADNQSEAEVTIPNGKRFDVSLLQ